MATWLLLTLERLPCAPHTPPQVPLWSRLWDPTSRGSFPPCSVTTPSQTTSTTWTCKPRGSSASFSLPSFIIAAYLNAIHTPLCYCVEVCSLCLTTAGKRLLRTWPFPTAGPRDPCWRGWTSSTQQCPSPSCMAHAPASTATRAASSKRTGHALMWRSS